MNLKQTEVIMLTEILLKKINEKRLTLDLSIEAIANELNMAESTLKNMCLHKTDNPGIKTFLPVAQFLGISVDEVLYPQQETKESSETSLLALKEIYEYQLSTTKETSETHINNIRSHYEQHHEDLRENYEKRLADKRELIDMQNMQITKIEETYQVQVKKLEKQNQSKVKIIWALASVLFVLFVGLIVLELMHPEHGWITFRTIH